MRPVFRKSILLFLMRLDAEGSMMSRLPAFIVEEEGEESENVLVIMFCFTAASGTKVAFFLICRSRGETRTVAPLEHSSPHDPELSDML